MQKSSDMTDEQTERRNGETRTDDGPSDDARDEQDLDTLREEIREIDRDLVDLIARRTYVADTIAQVKAAEGLPTTDEAQEERVMERAASYAERFEVEPELVKDVFRTLIELNKLEQRERR